jgi:putative endonuclease
MRLLSLIGGLLGGPGQVGSAALGRLGEKKAAAYLARQGLQILARNVRLAGAELDLVACQGDRLVFIEVKSSRAGSWCTGFEKIDAAKRRCLRRACRAYLQLLSREPSSYRFDGITVHFGSQRFWPRVLEIRWERGLFEVDK